MAISLLIINPNCSEKVTDNLQKVLSFVSTNDAFLSFYTAPITAPKEITNEQTSLESEAVVLADFKKRQEFFSKFDGFMVCCYSNHPLIKSLTELTGKPVLGIMQATLIYALSNPKVSKSFILTSTREWEPLLDQSIIDFVGASDFPKTKFQKTKGLDVSVLNLADIEEYERIRERVKEILENEYSQENINCVLLGCAGMAGLDSKLSTDFPSITFVDCVKSATELLCSLVRFEKQNLIDY
ncbi:DCG1 [Candida oxycetoniae]|uniref:DCG1 n=1 Tax=Candida oxycetoniae TaxID=497107 RepID=A0AAI9SYT3_9ASCO|nr:DCG1 [Candida oxycetoniae]KAI3405628.2 DCG1 [Candida oxycetoniae]